MAKLYLNRDELKQFPSLQDLVDLSKGKNYELWGLCQNDNGDVSFREAGDGWGLQITLNELFDDVNNGFNRQYKLDDVILVYYINQRLNNDLHFEVIELSTYEKDMLYCPPIEFKTRLTQRH